MSRRPERMPTLFDPLLEWWELHHRKSNSILKRNQPPHETERDVARARLSLFFVQLSEISNLGGVDGYEKSFDEVIKTNLLMLDENDKATLSQIAYFAYNRLHDDHGNEDSLASTTASIATQVFSIGETEEGRQTHFRKTSKSDIDNVLEGAGCGLNSRYQGFFLTLIHKLGDFEAVVEDVEEDGSGRHKISSEEIAQRRGEVSAVCEQDWSYAIMQAMHHDGVMDTQNKHFETGVYRSAYRFIEMLVAKRNQIAHERQHVKTILDAAAENDATNIDKELVRDRDKLAKRFGTHFFDNLKALLRRSDNVVFDRIVAYVLLINADYGYTELDVRRYVEEVLWELSHGCLANRVDLESSGNTLEEECIAAASNEGLSEPLLTEARIIEILQQVCAARIRVERPVEALRHEALSLRRERLQDHFAGEFGDVIMRQTRQRAPRERKTLKQRFQDFKNKLQQGWANFRSLIKRLPWHWKLIIVGGVVVGVVVIVVAAVLVPPSLTITLPVGKLAVGVLTAGAGGAVVAASAVSCGVKCYQMNQADKTQVGSWYDTMSQDQSYATPSRLVDDVSTVDDDTVLRMDTLPRRVLATRSDSDVSLRSIDNAGGPPMVGMSDEPVFFGETDVDVGQQDSARRGSASADMFKTRETYLSRTASVDSIVTQGVVLSPNNKG